MTERWKPKICEKYWVLDPSVDGGVTEFFYWEGDGFDMDQYNFGNCFRTKEEAEAAAAKVKSLLLDLHKNSEKSRKSEEPSQKSVKPGAPQPEIGQLWKKKDSLELVEITGGDYWTSLDRTIYVKKNDCSYGIYAPLFFRDFEPVEVVTVQKTPVSDSSDSEQYKKRGFLIPSHYDISPEPIEVIKKWKLGFCLGNVVKYIARAGRKAGESRKSDLHKAMNYLRMELEDTE